MNTLTGEKLNYHKNMLSNRDRLWQCLTAGIALANGPNVLKDIDEIKLKNKAKHSNMNWH